MQAYTKKVRDIFQELVRSGLARDEREQVAQLLQGQLPKYRPVALTLELLPRQLTFDDAENHLLAAELRKMWLAEESRPAKEKILYSKEGLLKYMT